MGILLPWLILSFVVAAFGADRKIGFWGALLLSLLLSPLIGFIGVALSERAKATSGPSTSTLIAADKFIRINEFDKAIAVLSKSLAFKADPISHYKLAVCYSQKEQTKKAMLHLSKAMELGFGDYNRIEQDPYLSWLRHQPEYVLFAENGFQINPPELKENKDVVAQLQGLAELLEKNLITEQEFQEQKRKILNT